MDDLHQQVKRHGNTLMISLIIVLIIIGAALYLVGLIPMDATYMTIIRVVLIVAVIIYLLRHLSDIGVNI
jgi:nucleoside recognition membrane protein YjiH